MFRQKGLKKKMRTFYFDIPLLHKQNIHGKNFIHALCNTSDIEIFKYFPI